jgi:Tfp pilus assembly protein PilF
VEQPGHDCRPGRATRKRRLRTFSSRCCCDQGYATALLNLGNVYRRQKSFAQAQEFLDQALAIQPDDPEINYSLGMFYAQQGQMQQASDYLQRAVDLRPDYPEALNNLGCSLCARAGLCEGGGAVQDLHPRCPEL